MLNMFKSFVRDEGGVTMIEYGLIAALVSVAAIGALVTLGGDLNTIFGHVSTCLQAATTATPTC